MEKIFYIIAYDSENLLSYNKLVYALEAVDFVDLNAYLLKNLKLLRQYHLDAFWFKAGKELGLEVEYEDENFSEETYERIEKEMVEKKMDVVKVANGGETRLALDVMIVEADNPILVVLQNQGKIEFRIELG